MIFLLAMFLVVGGLYIHLTLYDPVDDTVKLPSQPFDALQTCSNEFTQKYC